MFDPVRYDHYWQQELRTTNPAGFAALPGREYATFNDHDAVKGQDAQVTGQIRYAEVVADESRQLVSRGIFPSNHRNRRRD